MALDIAKLFKPKTKDTLIFQVSEEFIEVAGVRRVVDGAGAMGADGELTCATEMLYTQRLPRVKPAKKTLDDLAINMGKLADSAVVSKELASAGFIIGDANVVCILVEPLSTEALVTYSATLKGKKSRNRKKDNGRKITTKLLGSVLRKGEVTVDEMQDVSAEYAVYAEELSAVELNGYGTRRPLGKEAKRIDVTLAKHLTKPALWSAVGSVLESTFNRELRYMHRSEVIALDSPELCNEIYTGSELQEISHDIL